MGENRDNKEFRNEYEYHLERAYQRGYNDGLIAGQQKLVEYMEREVKPIQIKVKLDEQQTLEKVLRIMKEQHPLTLGELGELGEKGRE